MTNLEKILTADIYDMLVKANDIIMKKSFCTTCVIEAIEHKDVKCEYLSCKKCIREYLDKDGENK